jgi:serine phosphatase RsbU (regulator of sigma subunit)
MQQTKYLFFWICFFFASPTVFAQKTMLDSILRVVASVSDTAKVNHLNEFAAKMQETNADIALSASKTADSIAAACAYTEGEIKAKIRTGWLFYRKSYPEKAFEISKKALVLAEKINNFALLAEIYTNIAAIYNETGDYDASLQYFQKALEVNEKINNLKGIGRCLNNLAFTASKKKDFKAAADFVSRSLQHNAKIGEDYYLAFAYRTQGDIFLAEQKNNSAEKSWLSAYQTATKISNFSLMVSCLNRLGNFQLQNNNPKKASEYLQKAQTIAQKFGYRSDLRQTFEMLSKTYKAQGDFPLALQYHELFFEIHDATFNEESAKKLRMLQSVFESEAKEKEILLLKAEQKQTQTEMKQQQAQKLWIIFTASGILIAVSLITFLIFRSRNRIKAAFFALEKANVLITEKNEEINQQKEEILQTLQTVEEQRNVIQEKNENILASVRYALRIQDAILPPQGDLQRYFPESFILYLPRDIVSGDFYWFVRRGDFFILSVADCTGHGVSGAFMTMIGNNLLNQIVVEKGISAPNKILDLMTPLLEKTLQSGGEKIKDGMDVGILTFFLPDNTLQSVHFAGAMNPLYLVKNSIFTEIKADKLPIGGKTKENFFYKGHLIWQKNEEEPDSPDFLYLCSDGFQDQFGGKEDKKYMTGNLKKVLSRIAHEPAKAQKRMLYEEYSAWKGEKKQTDDILILGLSFAHM